MEPLEIFITRIPEFKSKSSGELIDYLAFYLQYICGQDCFTAKQISECFAQLAMPPYSNISSYLSKNSNTKGKFIKNSRNCTYVLNRNTKEIIAKDVSEIIEKPTSTNLIDLTLFDGTPYYIIAIAKEMIHCYDGGNYNATLVLMRKLIETLIIECFERYGIDNNIKDKDGKFFYLSDLIPQYLESQKWNSSRNIQDSISKVKKYGDLSAHNRRFLAKRSDIDSFKFELRQSIQEILLTIDYSTWERDK